MKYTETRFEQCLSLFEVELRHYSNYSRGSCEQCRLWICILYVEVHLDLLARNTCVHVPIRIILFAYLSAITINNYNQLAPMYTPKLQLIKHRSDWYGSNSELRNYWSRSDKAKMKMGCTWLKRYRTWFYTTYKILVLGAYTLKSLYAYLLQPPRPLRNSIHLPVTVTPQRFVNVLLPSWARSVVFGFSLDLHVLPYFVDYSRTGSDCALE